MFQFTTPQSGDPQKNKSAIAYQVRRHAAKVAAARQRRARRLLIPADVDDGATPPTESCFLLNLESDGEKPRQTSASIVKATEHVAGRRDQEATRPKWTSVYRLDMPKKTSSRSTPKTSPNQTPSPPTEPSNSEIDFRTGEDMDSIFDYANALPWPGSYHSFFETALDPPQGATSSDELAEFDDIFYHSLLTSGKHIPDPQASLLAFELGSGFQAINSLPPLLKHAQRRAVSATVALDQYQRESPGAPSLEDIVEEAEQSHMAFRALEIASPTATTSEGLVADCCRLAGLIYCELVLFPSFSQDEILPRLVGELRTALEIADFWVLEEESARAINNMLTWATTVGAMCDASTGSRGWFARRLSRAISSDERLRDWQISRSLLSKYLWWRPVCDQQGRMVWKEACKLAQPTLIEGSTQAGMI